MRHCEFEGGCDRTIRSDNRAGLCTEHARKLWHKLNPGRQYARTKAWRDKHPEMVASWRITERAKRYGLTREQYEQLLAEQDGKCAICHEPFTETPVIDHDHSCCEPSPRGQSWKPLCGGCVRGLLCGNCNKGCGNFDDNAALCESAAKYLRTARRT